MTKRNQLENFIKNKLIKNGYTESLDKKDLSNSYSKINEKNLA